MPKANWKERMLYFLGRRKAFVVSGDSMVPTLKSGAFVLVDPHSKIKIGDVLLAAHPYKTSVKILKRVVGIDAKNNLTLIGDNPAESTDSRTLGAVSIESILGRAVSRLK